MTILSFEKKYNFISFFLICIHFISFSCLTALARNSSMMLNRSSESEHLDLFLILVGKFLVSIKY